MALLLRGNVGGVLHHFERTITLVENRVVAGLQPHIGAVLAHAAVTPGVMIALAQPLPEFQIFRRLALVGVDEHAVMLPQHLVQLIAHGVQEILVGHQHMAFEIEFNNRLRFMDGGDLTIQVRFLHAALSTEQAV